LIVTSLIVTLRSEWERPERISWVTLTFLALSAVATGLSWLCYYRALQLGPASLVAPIDKLSVVLVMLLSFLFLGERPMTKDIVGCGLIVLGAILIVLK